MENMDLATIVESLINWIVNIGGQVNDLPGGLAFVLGLVTWFVVEQVLRRILSWMRWVILVGAIVGLGFTVPFVLGQFFSRAEPNILGQETQTLIPIETEILIPEE